MGLSITARRTPLIIAAWTLLLLFSCLTDIHDDYDNLRDQAELAALVAFEKDIIFRRWNAMSGGVYVQITETSPPNPYLRMPNRDVTTDAGQHLTMVNPAYMTRQAHELQMQYTGVLGHITSLDPIRPGNAPDDWERAALERFDHGEDKTVSVETMDGKRYLRFMRPLLVEKSCLTCHQAQGYEEGQIRGGISVAVPLEPQLAAFSHDTAKTVGIHGLIWLAGLGGIVFGSRSVTRSLRSAREAGDRALEASKAKSEFLANMSHEIRTPLTGIVGMLELLRETKVNAEQANFVDKAMTASMRLTRLLTDILDLSRVEAGRLDIRNEPFSFRDFMSSVEQLFIPAATRQGLALSFSTDSSIPTRLMGDSARLQQILGNLLGNALKFTPSGGKVNVEAWALPAPAPARCRVLFRVADTGIGIPDELHGKLFEAFTQAENNYRRQHQGAGLGLSITKRMVELMGGVMAMESAEGQGTTFYLSIPFDCDPEMALEDQEGQRPNSGGHKILLAEDDPNSLYAVAALLERYGHQVTSVTDGRRALEALEKEPFDLVLMDVQMPELDGVAATRAIRAGEAGSDRAGIPIIAMTAYAMTGDRETFLGAGMDEYVAKPVDMDLLLQAIRTVLREPGKTECA